MENLFVKNPHKIWNLRKKLEKTLDVKLIQDNEGIHIEGEGINEYGASLVLDAIDIGFNPRVALLLKDPDYMMEKINLKNYVRISRLNTVRGRIIGREGKAKNQLAQLTDCEIVVYDSTIAILGLTEDVDVASKAIRSLIKGSPHTSVFQYLEKARKIKKEKELLGIEDKI